jgi:hypothetical protein
MDKMFKDRGEVKVVVEVPPQFVYARNKEAWKHLSDAERATRICNFGQNRREGQLIAEGLRLRGFYVIEVPPVPIKKWNLEKFQVQFHTNKTANEHERDACRLALFNR